ncbi:MAG: sigma-70 family RNA polymerase sigma factor [Myxococcota bacterium]
MSLDQRQLHDLYDSYGPAVRARCRAICGNEADADEALQETFLRAWKARRRFDGRYPLAWLQTIARNTALDILRKRKPWKDDPLVWLKVPAPERSAPSTSVDVERLLDSFPAEEAVMLRLRLGEDWRIHEIAEHFGTSQRTIRRRLQRLEKRARAILDVPEPIAATASSD